PKATKKLRHRCSVSFTIFQRIRGFQRLGWDLPSWRFIHHRHAWMKREKTWITRLNPDQPLLPLNAPIISASGQKKQAAETSRKSLSSESDFSSGMSSRNLLGKFE